MEVALQFAFLLSDRQFVRGLGKVIHADVAVAVLREPRDGVHHDIDLFQRGGQIGIENAALRRENMRQVRIVVKRNTVRRQFQYLVKRFFKALAALLGKPVDQVHVNGMKARFARSKHRIARHLKRLDAVNGFLHVGVKVLNTATHAVKADLG